MGERIIRLEEGTKHMMVSVDDVAFLHEHIVLVEGTSEDAPPVYRVKDEFTLEAARLLLKGRRDNHDCEQTVKDIELALVVTTACDDHSIATKHVIPLPRALMQALHDENKLPSDINLADYSGNPNIS